jgi:pyrimidine nucleoside transport protein
MEKPKGSNVIEAAENGASVAVQLVLKIGGQLIAFLALVAMLDGFLAGSGSLIDQDLSLASICSVILYPFAWLMGVEPKDCSTVASLLGTKIFVNEFVAYSQLAELLNNNELD